MTDYHVYWEIEVEADSPEHAARRAYDAFCRPGSFAHVFEVTDTVEYAPDTTSAQRVRTTRTVDIDRAWELNQDVEPVSYPMSREH
jgi:hypothetical protein